MPIEASFIRDSDSEVVHSALVGEDIPYAVVNHEEGQPRKVLLTQSASRDQGALIFELDSSHLIRTEGRVVVSSELLCFSSLIAYVPPGLQARYEMMNADGETGTFVVTPETPQGYLN